jgi:hypothetical protein
MAAGRIIPARRPRVRVPSLHSTNELKVSYESTVLIMGDSFVLFTDTFNFQD